MNPEYYAAPTTETLPMNFYTGTTTRVSTGQAVEHQFTGSGYYEFIQPDPLTADTSYFFYPEACASSSAMTCQFQGAEVASYSGVPVNQNAAHVTVSSQLNSAFDTEIPISGADVDLYSLMSESLAKHFYSAPELVPHYKVHLPALIELSHVLVLTPLNDFLAGDEQTLEIYMGDDDVGTPEDKCKTMKTNDCDELMYDCGKLFDFELNCEMVT